MLRFRLLPWEYGVRNLLRRPGRSLLTLGGLTTVILLIFIVVGFLRGMEASLVASGDPRVMLVYSLGAAEDIENSSIAAGTADLIAASVEGIERRYGQAYVSPEIYLGSRVTVGTRRPVPGIVRGVTIAAPLLRRQVQLTEGRWPGPGEVLAGRMATAKLDAGAAELAIGQTVRFENRQWRISGWFAAGGSAFESELWCPLDDLQQATKRQDLSLVAVGLSPDGRWSDVELFCKERLDLELQAVRETEYYASLERHYQPVRMLGWLVVALVASAGIFAALNTMYGAVVGRVRELSTLQAVGFRRRAIVLSLIQEATLLSTTGSLLAALVAIGLIQGAAVRFTMGAFALRIDGVCLALGCAVGLLLGLIGAIPPAIKALRVGVADGLKAI